MIVSVVSDHWVRQINGKFTFCGALEEHYTEIARRWGKTTQNQYNRDYNDRILPNLIDHDSKTIDMYLKEDYDDAITRISTQKTISANASNVYADTTIQHFRHLIEVVVETAARHGMCDNVLWGSAFSLPVSPSRHDKEKERISLKKSLTIGQEYQVADALLSNIQQRGQEMGLLLMYALGLRNGEACGANYSDIKPMASHPDCKTLWVYKSTKAGSNILQASGKTKNADRIIPLPSALCDFISRRRDYLEQSIDFSTAPQGFKSVDDLPIACLNDDFFTRCSAARLTAAGRELFRKIKMNQNQLAYIDASLSSPENMAMEKDPSAYLFRRNYGTHLQILGLNEAEIQYVIGYDIEDLYETRNEFVNEEKLYEIKKKLDCRPILNTTAPLRAEITLSKESTFKIEANFPAQRIIIPTEYNRVNIHLTANEPGDAITIHRFTINHRQRISEQICIGSISKDFPRTVNILSIYHRLYKQQKT